MACDGARATIRCLGDQDGFPMDKALLPLIAIAFVGKVSRPGCTLANHIALASVGLVAVHPSLHSMQQVRVRPVTGS